MANDKLTDQRKAQHLAWRAGFGEPYSRIHKLMHKSTHAQVKLLLENSREAKPIAVVAPDEMQEMKKMRREIKASPDASPEERQRLRKQVNMEKKDDYRDLNQAWLDKMVTGEDQLRERMTYFWHNHFASRSGQAYLTQLQNNTLRTHALGSFRTLMLAIAEDPSMLDYLNNQQNRKQSPNENFAREVMELFTLGRGNYTEADIKNGARAFTGWGHDKEGKFVMREKQHDYDEKTFRGHTGPLSGEQVIQILLDDRQTASFITRKMYRYFVNEQVNTDVCDGLAKDFYESDYDISKLLEAMFTADWFYDPANIGTRIKSPVELLVGLQRSFNIEILTEGAPQFIQKVLGQQLYNPPNVAGWPSGRNWIDTSTLLFRMKLAEVLLHSAEIHIVAKDDGDEDNRMMTRMKNEEKHMNTFHKLETRTSFDAFARSFSHYDKPEDLLEALSAYLLQVELSPKGRALALADVDPRPGEKRTFDMALKLLSLPEYQLC